MGNIMEKELEIMKPEVKDMKVILKMEKLLEKE